MEWYDNLDPLLEEKENNCSYCNEPSKKDFCNKECYNAYLND